MTSEENLRAALVAYRDAVAGAREAAKSAAEQLANDILVTSIVPFQMLIQCANSMFDGQVDQAIAQLDARAAAMKAAGAAQA